MAVLGADDEDFAGCFDGVGGDGVEVVDGHDAGDLVHESFDEAEVAAGDADDGDDGFGVGGSLWVVGFAELLPVLGEDLGDVCGVQWPVVVGESDSTVELRVAGQASFEAGHPDQDYADVAGVEVVADQFQSGGFQAVGLVDL